MQHVHAIRLSDLESAKNRKDAQYLRTQLEAGRKAIQNGDTVRIQQQFSDASVETLHILDTEEQLELFMSRYLS